MLLGVLFALLIIGVEDDYPCARAPFPAQWAVRATGVRRRATRVGRAVTRSDGLAPRPRDHLVALSATCLACRGSAFLLRATPLSTPMDMPPWVPPLTRASAREHRIPVHSTRCARLINICKTGSAPRAHSADDNSDWSCCEKWPRDNQLIYFRVMSPG